MILATDVQYAERGAKAAGLVFACWESDEIIQEIIRDIDSVAPYTPGEFYKRELPCLLELLKGLGKPVDAILVDGYVTLGKEANPGLGMHLYEAINGSTPVIGVAKKEFIGTPEECRIFRGSGSNPLYVSAIGVPLEQAKSAITRMHGEFRIPTVLKMVDRVCRGIGR